MRQGDGYSFREREVIQLAGRSNYKDFTTKAKEWGWIDNVADFEAKPDLILQNGKYALLSAVWFWNDKKCYKIADKQTSNNANEIVKQITKKVNGGYNGLDERQKAFKRIRFGSSNTANISNGIFRDF